MKTSILAIIATALSMIVGLWKYFSRKNMFKRELMGKAEKELNDAQKNKDKSSLLDAWGNANGV